MRGYRYVAPANKERWNTDLSDRLSSADFTHQALGGDGLFAVIYNPASQRPVACAATKRWKADLEGYADEGETGWEIETITTHLDWMDRDLAGLCVDASIDELARQEQLRRENENSALHGPLNIWTQAVECLNGSFWLKRGGRLM